MSSSAGELYFLGEIDPFTGERSPFVKIGLVRENKNRGTAHRLREHQTGNPREITELRVMTTPEVETIETTIHGLLASRRIGGEWFRLDDGNLDQAIAQAASLVEAMGDAEPSMRAAEQFDQAESTGEKLAVSAASIVTARELVTARFILSTASDAERRVREALLESRTEGWDISRYVTVQEKVTKPSFDRSTFAADHPEIHERFVTLTSAMTARFTPVTAAKFGLIFEDLPEDFRENITWVTKTANRVAVGDESPALLHSMYLEMLAFVARAKFAARLAEWRLKELCGSSPGITGVCTWNRQIGEKVVFDQAAFEAEHPDLMARYTKPASTVRSVVVAKDLGYRLRG